MYASDISIGEGCGRLLLLSFQVRICITRVHAFYLTTDVSYNPQPQLMHDFADVPSLATDYLVSELFRFISIYMHRIGLSLPSLHVS